MSHPVFYFIHYYCNGLQTPVIRRRQLGVPRTPQFEIYILRAAHALGCARFFCYQVICRFSILNESELVEHVWRLV